MTEALKREYQIHEELGRGRFGVVFRCTSLATGDSFAVKSIEKRLVSGDSLDAQCLLSEPKILHFVSPHPNIVSISRSFEDENHLHMVLDLVDSPDLQHRILRRGTLPESEAAAVITQVMNALVHCHRNGIAHRDVKPENILVEEKVFGDSQTCVVKLADFGSAEFFQEGEKMSGVVGTPYYVAPEVLMGRDYCEKVDVWSAGVVLYVMLAGILPFYGEDAVETFEKVIRGNLRFPSRVFCGVSAEAKDLIRRMVCKDVSRRFSAEQVLSKFRI